MNTKQSTASDAQLVDRVRQHDQSAFGDIYDRYADDIYTFCRSRLRNDADAADAMQETFVRAATRMSQLRDPAKLRSWLFAIARNQIIATGKVASRAIGGEAMGEVIDLRAHVDQDLLRAEASAQLWDAAAGLSDRDQEVLELHLRHGLSGQALADAMGVSESHANVMMTRLRDRIATSLGGLLVARSGRQECDELNMLLAGWDGKFTIDLRGKVTRHIRSCEVCERTKTTALAAGAFMLPMVKAPAGLRIGTIDKMLEATTPAGIPGRAARETRWDTGLAAGTSVGGGAVWHWREDGFPYPEEEPGVLTPISTGTSWLLATAIFVFVALLGAGAWLVLGNESNVSVEVAGAVSLSETDDGPTTTGEIATSSSAADSTSTTDAALAPATSAVPAGDEVDDDAEVAAPPTTVASTTAAPTTQPSTTAPPTTAAPTTAAPTTAAPTTPAPTTAAPTTVAPTTAAPTTAAPTTAAPTTATPTTAAPPPTTEEPPPTTEEPPPTTEEPPNQAPIIRSAQATPLGVVIRNAGCNGELTQLVVEVVDDGEIGSVVASWAPSSDSPTVSTELNGRGPSVYTAAIGPWTESGPQTIGVVVTDDRGATSTANASVRVAACPIGDFAG